MKKAYFCIDGFSFKRVSDFYKHEHDRRSRLSVAAMEAYLRYEIERRFEWKSDFEHLKIEKHFYQPSENPQRAFYKSDVKEAILKFEKNITYSGYEIHYAQTANMAKPMPNKNMFADWVVANELRKFDIFILFSTQGQYANILQQAKQCKIPSMLIGWNSSCRNSTGENSRWKTDRALIKYANVYCPLERMLNLPNKKHPLADIMFEKFSNLQQLGAYPRYPLSQLCG